MPIRGPNRATLLVTLRVRVRVFVRVCVHMNYSIVLKIVNFFVHQKIKYIFALFNFQNYKTMENNNVLNLRELHNRGIDSNEINNEFFIDGLGVSSGFLPKDLSISNQLLFSSVNKLHLVMRVVDALVTSHAGDRIHITCDDNDTCVDIYMGF